MQIFRYIAVYIYEFNIMGIIDLKNLGKISGKIGPYVFSEKRWKTKDLHFWLYLSRFDLTQNPDSVYVKCKIKLSIYQ
jgi:hypothetical protein